MKRVYIKIGEQEYQKTEPLLQDWLDNIELAPGLKGGMHTKEGIEAYMEMVSRYLSVEVEVLKTAKLADVIDAFRKLNDNIAECFPDPELDENGEVKNEMGQPPKKLEITS